ncbi:type IV toxin-antitoxin system YeeU family antitoxin [Aeromonas hydrophila]|nr:type IV toxin-antitoxin system YeeU family antitoxin [Aeromonas hydrophila]WDA26970.1 type IV toxin-antitoxin system YeeU family antitoxin [Aeromonas hydrophila]WES95593.1 type IV toxin-antitoxin system YeeU family antitoxin [Aeromonas hydrophila]
MKELESKLLTGELDAQCYQRVTVQHAGFTCEAALFPKSMRLEWN